MIDHAPTKLVLLCIADHCNEEDECFPSIGRISQLTGLCESSVRNSMIKLEALGFLERSPRIRENGSFSSNSFRLNIGEIACPVRPLGISQSADIEIQGVGIQKTPPTPCGVPSTAWRGDPPRRTPPEPTNKNLPINSSGKGEKTARKRDEIFDAIAIATGIELTEINQINGSMIAKAKQQILQSTPTVTPDEIRNRAIAYRTKWPNAALTPTALAKHWPTLGTQNGSGTTKQQLLSHMP